HHAGGAGLTVSVSVQRTQPPGLAREWERLFDFGNGPEQDSVFLAFDGNPYWDPALSCCFPMRYAVWRGTQYEGAVNWPLGEGSGEDSGGASFPRNEWVHVALVHEPDGTATIYWDGVAKASGYVPLPLAVERSGLYIGRSHWGTEPNGGRFEGTMRDFFVFNAALTEAQLTALREQREFPTIDGMYTAPIITAGCPLPPLPPLPPPLPPSSPPPPAPPIKAAPPAAPGAGCATLAFDGTSASDVNAVAAEHINAGGAGLTVSVSVQRTQPPGLARAWERLFDFGNGPEQDSVFLAFDGNPYWDPALSCCFPMRYDVYQHGTYQYAGGRGVNVPLGEGNGEDSGGASFPRNEWVHVALVHKPDGTATIYWDGVAKASGYVPLPLAVERSGLYIGRSHWGTEPNGGRFEGTMRDFFVFNAALTEAQLTALREQREFPTIDGMYTAPIITAGCLPPAPLSPPSLPPPSPPPPAPPIKAAPPAAPGAGCATLAFDGTSASDVNAVAAEHINAGGAGLTVSVSVQRTQPPGLARAWERLFDFGNGPEQDSVFLAFDGNPYWDPALSCCFPMRYDVYQHGTYQYAGGRGVNVPLGEGNGEDSGGASFPRNEWVHVALVHKPDGTATIYWDGVAKASGYVPLPLAVERSGLYIGRSHWGTEPNGGRFEGTMRDFFVFNAALTEAQLAALREQREFPTIDGMYTAPIITAGCLPPAPLSPPSLPPPSPPPPAPPIKAAPPAAPGAGCATLAFDGTSASDVNAVAAEHINAGGAGLTVSVSVQRTQPPGLAREWERLFDFGNGPEQDSVFLAFDGNPYWDPALSCCFPMRYAVWRGTQYEGAVNWPLGEGSGEDSGGASFPRNEWVHVALVHEPDGTATIYWDGVAKASGYVPLPLAVERSGLYIGRSHWGTEPNGGRFEGTMRDFFVFNAALTEAQLTALREQREFPTIDGMYTAPIITAGCPLPPLPPLPPPLPPSSPPPPAPPIKAAPPAAPGAGCATLAFDGTSASDVNAVAAEHINAGGAGLTVSVSVQRTQPPGLAREWERLFDFGNGPEQDSVFLAFDGNPFWDPALSCCFPMRYAVWRGTQYAGAVNWPLGEGSGEDSGGASFPRNEWVHVALVHEPDGTATIYWDGVAKASGYVPLPLAVERSGLYIGRSHWGTEPNGGRFEGTMRDFFVFNAALTEAQLTALREQREFPTIDGMYTAPIITAGCLPPAPPPLPPSPPSLPPVPVKAAPPAYPGAGCATLAFDGTNASDVNAVAAEHINAGGAGLTVSLSVQRTQPPGLAREWERLFDFGNGPDQDSVFLAFDANPWWYPALSCCFPMRYEVWHGTQYAGA
ncbi:hypothetical protein EMIHUDRAFT_123123, partial [Emiliania huxleyi CCMP1516]|uniref:LamG-like jellyroll fold domain-containing protein n=2 Tax=Emiliania huxleyi TaxID=2903 RepID=A0A0D3K4I3_EMIH1